MNRRSATAILAGVVLGACGGDADTSSPTPTDPPAATTSSDRVAPADAADDDRYPDVLDVAADYDDGSGTWTFAVTISSPYDTPERYADGWRVVDGDGTVFGVHTLGHDHANEQPFTRRQTGVSIPADVREVTIEGRDRKHGFGGRTVTILLQTGSP